MREAAPPTAVAPSGPAQPSGETAASLRKAGGRWPEFGWISGAFLYLYANLFMLRGVPFLLGGDQVYFWLYAQRLSHGEIPYRDFLQFTPAGTDVVYMAALRLFGDRICAPNLVVLALGVALCWICFRIAAGFLSTAQALLAASLVLVLAYGKLLNGTHHWFGELAVLGAAAVLFNGQSRTRFAVAGCLLGTACFFTQTRGVAAAVGVAAYLVWSRWRTRTPWRDTAARMAILPVCLLVVWVALNGYFFWSAGWSKAFYWLVIYVARYYSTGPFTLGLPGRLTPKNALGLAPYLAPYIVLPVVYAISLYAGWNRQPTPPTTSDDRRMLLTFIGIATALELASAPNWLRVYCAAAPGIILCVWCIGLFRRLPKLIFACAWLFVAAIAIGQTWSRHRPSAGVIFRSPAGALATNRETAEKLAWIAERTHPGDFFFQAAWPGVYLPLDLRDPAFADSLGGFDPTRPELVSECIGQLEGKRVEYVLWAERLNSPPAEGKPATYHLAPLVGYLREHYRIVHQFHDGDQVWQRTTPR